MCSHLPSAASSLNSAGVCGRVDAGVRTGGGAGAVAAVGSPLLVADRVVVVCAGSVAAAARPTTGSRVR